MAGMKCFTVEFDRGDNEPKIIWADTFRLSDDEVWVDFYDADGGVISSVRALHVLAVDRACAVPIAERPQDDASSSASAPRQAAAGAGLPGASSSPAAGPVEAAALAAARGVPPQGRPQQAPQGDAAAAIATIPGSR